MTAQGRARSIIEHLSEDTVSVHRATAHNLNGINVL